jgi:hypothetical protein
MSGLAFEAIFAYAARASAKICSTECDSPRGPHPVTSTTADVEMIRERIRESVVFIAK